MTGTTHKPPALSELAFYASPPHDCSYLPNRQAVTLFADPETPMRPELYHQLAQLGFRRSGDYVYRPHCSDCQACRPVRVPVQAFIPNRSQRRNWQLNQDLQVGFVGTDYREEHFELYQRYIHSRHAGGGMDVDDRDQYMHFLTSHWGDTEFIEFRHHQQLLGVAVVDVLDSGLSAVYTFFDPDHPQRGLGNFAVLWEIEAVKQRGQAWLYLGYWIEASPKMTYKAAYRPLEVLENGRWQRLKRGD